MRVHRIQQWMCPRVLSTVNAISTHPRTQPTFLFQLSHNPIPSASSRIEMLLSDSKSESQASKEAQTIQVHNANGLGYASGIKALWAASVNISLFRANDSTWLSHMSFKQLWVACMQLSSFIHTVVRQDRSGSRPDFLHYQGRGRIYFLLIWSNRILVICRKEPYKLTKTHVSS